MENSTGEYVIDGIPYVMCKPSRVVEIGANEWYAYENAKIPAVRFENGVWRNIGLFPGVKGQKPRFMKDEHGNVKERHDKGVNPTDLRLTQCPDFEGEWLNSYMEGREIQIDRPSSDDWNIAALASIFGAGDAPQRVQKGVEEKNKKILSDIFVNPPKDLNNMEGI